MKSLGRKSTIQFTPGGAKVDPTPFATSCVRKTEDTIGNDGWFHVIELHRLYSRRALINAARSNKLIRGLPVPFILPESRSFFPPPSSAPSLPFSLLPFQPVSTRATFRLFSFFPFFFPPFSPSPSSHSRVPPFHRLTRSTSAGELSLRPVTRATLGISHN